MITGASDPPGELFGSHPSSHFDGGAGEQAPSPPLRAILKLTYRCTNRCRFCRADEYRGVVEDLPFEKAVRLLVEAKRLGVAMVLFSGGEPTLRADLPRLARTATALGLRWGLITNGRRLVYQDYREALFGLGLEYVHTSLHGARAETHDEIVQCAGYAEVLKALRGLRSQGGVSHGSSRPRAGGIEIHVNTVIAKTNIGELYAISDLLAGLAPLTHKLCLMEPRGLFIAHEQALIVRPEVAARAAIRTTLRAREVYAAVGLRTEIEGFPFCQVPPEMSAGLHTHNIRFMCEGFEDRFYPADQGERTHLTLCARCGARPTCPGVYVGYAERFGTAGLRSLKASRPRRSPATRPPRGY